MLGHSFRIATSTIAVQVVDGENLAVIIPTGAVVRVCGEAPSDNRMIQVDWENKLLMMFKLDLRERGVEVRPAHAD